MITNTQQNQTFGTTNGNFASANNNLRAESSSGIVPGSSGVQSGEQNRKQGGSQNVSSENSDRKEFSKHIESESDAKSSSDKISTEKAPPKKDSVKTPTKGLAGELSEPPERTNSVAHQVLKQLVKQNPAAKPPALRFLESQPQPALHDELPHLMASSRFIADALLDRDLSGYLEQSVKPSHVMLELGFGPEIVVQAMAMGVDGSGAIQRGQTLDAMGLDSKNIESGLSQLKDSIVASGLTGFMQQSLALTQTSGRSQDLVDEITGEFVQDSFLDATESDVDNQKWPHHNEMHAFMTQAMSFSGGQFSTPLETLSTNLERHGKTVAAIGALENSDALSDVSVVPLDSFGDTITAQALDLGHEVDQKEDSGFIPLSVSNGFKLIPSTQIDGTSDESGALNTAKFQTMLAEEFASDIKVIAVGESAWESSAEDVWTGIDLGPLNTNSDLAAEAPTGGASEQSFTVTIDDLMGLRERSPESSQQDDGLELASEVATDIVSDFSEERQQISELSRNFMPGEAFVSESDTHPEANIREKLEVGGRHAAEVVRKIQDAARHTSVSNIGAMRLDLSSSETGQLEVIVRMDADQQVDVRLIAGSEELKELIVRDLPQLRSALADQSLNLRNFETRAVQELSSQMFTQADGQGGFFSESRDGASGDGQGQSRRDRGATGPLTNVNQQIGRQALRSFRVLDLTDRSVAGAGRIKVLA